jgi:sodium transport system permease protein
MDIGEGEEKPPAEPTRREAPEPIEGAFLFLLILFLILAVGRLIQRYNIILGLLVTEWVLIALPILIFIHVRFLSGRLVLNLRSASPIAFVGALLTGLSAWYLVGVLVENVQQQVFPLPKEMIEESQRLLFSSKRHLLVDLFALALSPAVCEELLFRGVLLSLSRKVLRIPGTVLLNGLLFGLFHMNPYRFFPTMLLGFVLAVIVAFSGSIFPAMLFHFLNNAMAILVGRLLDATGEGTMALSPFYTTLALAMFLAGINLMREKNLR